MSDITGLPEGCNGKLLPDGSILVSVDTINGVTVGNIFHLSSHRIFNVDDTLVHQLVFKNGGTAKIAIQGSCLKEFTTKAVAFQITAEKIVILDQMIN